MRQSFQAHRKYPEATPVKGSRVNVSFLADFPKKKWGISHEEEAVFT
jgi:hypothetical protein